MDFPEAVHDGAEEDGLMKVKVDDVAAEQYIVVYGRQKRDHGKFKLSVVAGCSPLRGQGSPQ
eukprot:COSAG05_NODE_8832_length_668_cov_0.585237_1_plen_62_part_00